MPNQARDTAASKDEAIPHRHSHSEDEGRAQSDRHDHGEGDGHSHADGGILGRHTELIFSLGCGLLLGVGFAIEIGRAHV